LLDAGIPEPVSGRTRLSRIVEVSLFGSFLLLVIGAAYYARGFVLPLVLSTLLSLTLLPIVRSLSRRGVPAAVSAILLVLAMAGVVAGMATIVAAPLAQAVKDAPHIAATLRDRFDFLRGPIATISQAGDQLRALASPPSPGQPQPVVLAPSGMLSWAADTVTGIGTTLGATLILAIFLLSSSDLFLEKIVQARPKLRDKKQSLRIVYDLQLEVAHYLFTITIINIAFGVVIGSVFALIGMPHPLVWAVSAMLLNYIPYVGPVTGIVVTTAVGLITFPLFGLGLLPPAIYLGLHGLESAFLTPLIVGRRLELNAVAILIALTFGAWMWGIVGAVIAVPLLVVVKVFTDHLPSLARFGEFLSAATSSDAPEE